MKGWWIGCWLARISASAGRSRGWTFARYADTNGYEKDRPRSIWPWRDWVIEAINRDLPFDQFTIEQLAGDMLPNATRAQRSPLVFIATPWSMKKAALIRWSFVFMRLWIG